MLTARWMQPLCRQTSMSSALAFLLGPMLHTHHRQCRFGAILCVQSTVESTPQLSGLGERTPNYSQPLQGDCSSKKIKETTKQKKIHAQKENANHLEVSQCAGKFLSFPNQVKPSTVPAQGRALPAL